MIKLLLIGGLLYMLVKPAISVYFSKRVEETTQTVGDFSPGISISPLGLVNLNPEEYNQIRLGTLWPDNPDDEEDLWDQ